MTLKILCGKKIKQEKTDTNNSAGLII